MGQWGYVFLAYGIVWCAILIYVVRLKRRIRRAAAMAALPAGKEVQGDEA